MRVKRDAGVESGPQVPRSRGVGVEADAEVAGNEEGGDATRQEGALEDAPRQNGNSSQSSSRLLSLTQVQTTGAFMIWFWPLRVIVFS